MVAVSTISSRTGARTWFNFFVSSVQLYCCSPLLFRHACFTFTFFFNIKIFIVPVFFSHLVFLLWHFQVFFHYWIFDSKWWKIILWFPWGILIWFESWNLLFFKSSLVQWNCSCLWKYAINIFRFICVCFG